MHIMAINKSNLYNRKMRQSSSSTETCYVCIHIETFLKSKERAQWCISLWFIKHLSLTHKLQNRARMQDMQLQMEMFHDKYALLVCWWNSTVAYCMEALTKDCIIFHHEHNVACSSNVLHDNMSNKCCAVENGIHLIKSASAWFNADYS